MLAQCLVKGLCLIMSTAINTQPLTETYIPPQAFKYQSTISEELDKHFNELPDYAYVPSLIEHESCISLKNKRCWEPSSRLKTAREEGAGLGQITKAYNKDGSLRFDKVTELQSQYKTELKEMSWKNIYTRPDLQIRSIVLMLRDDYRRFNTITSDANRLAFTDAAYNGGRGGVNKDRRACSLKDGCDSTKWFGNVEYTCTKSKKALYGKRSACDINRDHVKDVMLVNLPKYRTYYFR